MRLVSFAVAFSALLVTAPMANAEPPKPASVASVEKTSPRVDADMVETALLKRRIGTLEERLAALEKKTETLEQFATRKALELLEAQLEIAKLVKADAKLVQADAGLTASLAALTQEYRGHTHQYSKTRLNYINASCEDCSSNDPHFGDMVSFIWGIDSTQLATDTPTPAE